jgi:hypothetical protein
MLLTRLLQDLPLGMQFFLQLFFVLLANSLAINFIIVLTKFDWTNYVDNKNYIQLTSKNANLSV